MFTNVGIPYINCTFSSFDTMIQSIQMTAEVLGGEAIEIANAYVAYLNEKIDWLTELTGSIAEEDKISVLHGNSIYNLTVDGTNTIIDAWIKTAGGLNAVGNDVSGNFKSVTLEQIITWDPDVIIVGKVGDVELIMNDPAWAVLKAVKNGNVYLNPAGVFAWDRYGVEEALQIQWTAQLLYPELFEGEDFDISEEVKYFYTTFFNYNLSDEQVAKILAHENP